MRKGNSYFTIFESLLYIILGIIIIIWPTQITGLIINISGILLIISGLVSIYRSIKIKDNPELQVFAITQSALGFIFGLMLLIGNSFVITLVLVYILIFWFLFRAISHTAILFQQKRFNWLGITSIILNILVIVISIWAFFNAQLAFSIFIWTIAILFISSGLEGIILFFISDKDQPDVSENINI
ncbi:DUF308 domain-containing protein [Culicoidibacter larvae]|uniref:DUF308 domain-containing protein n=1 Tax=Culicoidibacter larvae TaxID=2579976 RepID=A0A5R8QCL9_9FIRM|nr:DUF308 domain-containing protein [Culicoidibacter larvae]TLG74321.1 hypothetical protein FEZ08_06335 [Culicoidibacter larvae]